MQFQFPVSVFVQRRALRWLQSAVLSEPFSTYCQEKLPERKKIQRTEFHNSAGNNPNHKTDKNDQNVKAKGLSKHQDETENFHASKTTADICAKAKIFSVKIASNMKSHSSNDTIHINPFAS